MKILWIVNTIFPYPAMQLKTEKCVFGGWLNGLADQLKEQENIELGIATAYNGNEIKKYYDGKITYYLMPGAPALKYDSKLNKYCKIILNEFKPELLHIHGTEYAHGLSFINVCNDNIKKIVSIQGLISYYEKVYLANIPYNEIIKNITLRDIIRRDNLFQQKNKFRRRGRNEIEIIKKADAILGRTTWDYANTKAINLNEKYYCSNETLRQCFYNQQWNIENIDRYTIFCSQAGYPIKGFHFLLETIAILKKQYPMIKLFTAGENILNRGFKTSGYARYLSKLIDKYEVSDNVIFTGLLSEEEMAKKLLKTHVFVLPSAIENSSNSLGEAMLLGMPCVATNTGGTMDMLEHRKEGYLYPYTEPAMCAEYISNFFEDDELAIRMGKTARRKALESHDPEKNVTKLLEIYKEVIEEK